MNKEYDPSSIEPKWQANWEKEKPYKTPELPKGKKLYVLDMFPYPSGAGLHIGHPLGYTATDIYSRFKRLQGYSVLHPMGYDAFGLPAEQHAINTGEHPGVITDQNCSKFTQQMKRIGLSYDWDRELQTCTKDYYKWTQWIFLKLYNSWFDKESNKARPIEELPIPSNLKSEKEIFEYQAEFRLAFYADAMVNWCPALGTVLANEEVIDGKSERGGHDVIRKPMKQWMLRITSYAERLLDELADVDWPEAIKEQQRNWIGKRIGYEIDFIDPNGGKLTCFTTRVDTLFGVTFFVVSPEHPIVTSVTTAEQKQSVEKYCDDAKKLSDLDRTIENRKKTGVFTGSYVVNPINNEKVPLYVGDYVLMGYGTGAVMGVPAHDERDFEFARLFNLPVRPVLAPFETDPAFTKVTEGDVAWTEPGLMLPCPFKVGQELKIEGLPNERAKEVIGGWLVDNKNGKKVVNYKLRDWLFSRQRYWGEPIPIVHWEDGTSSSLSEQELPLVLPEIQNYKPSESGESPLANAGEWLQVTCPKTGKKGRRETNTMPQWAGSCWYYLRFIDPKNDKYPWDREKEKAWMPVDLYVGGAEHAVLHLLYSRFWHKVLFDLGYVSTREPFQRLYNQGMVLANAYKDKRGALIPVDEVKIDDSGKPISIKTGEILEQIVAKMSKSLKNVINPEDVIREYGADTLRLYLMFMGPLDSGRIWDSQAISGVHRFLKRSFAWIRDWKDGEESKDVAFSRHKLIKRVTESTEELKFNTGIAAFMEFLNEVSGKPASRDTVSAFVTLLTPYAPHLASELAEMISVKVTTWLSWDAEVLKTATVPVVIQVNGKKRGLIEVDPEIEEAQLRTLVSLELEKADKPLSEKDRVLTVYQPNSKVPRLVNVVRNS